MLLSLVEEVEDHTSIVWNAAQPKEGIAISKSRQMAQCDPEFSEYSAYVRYIQV